jgi:hypothetical protein
MSITILNSLAESRTHFGGEGCSMPPFAALEPFMYNRYLSADSLIELLLQHQKQVEIAAVKEATGGLGNLLDGDNRLKVSQFYTTFNPNLSS